MLTYRQVINAVTYALPSDPAFTIRPEFCGHPNGAQYVIRFRGEWKGSAPSKPEAIRKARELALDRSLPADNPEIGQ